jgi:hypothetical protein
MSVPFDRIRMLSLVGAALIAGATWTPAYSQFGGFSFPGVRIPFPIAPRGGGGGGGCGQNCGGGYQGAQPTPGQQDQKLQTENTALTKEAQRKIRENDRFEQARDVNGAIQAFLKVLEKEHQKLRNNPDVNVRAAYGASINQITEGEVRLAVERAFQEARLNDFDTLAGEIWTRERLIVQILQDAQIGILPYFKGVGARGPDMNNLHDVFRAAAEEVYARALELAEIIGVSRSFDRFIRTIYENSDQAPVSLQTVGADVQYERLLTRAVNEVDRAYFAPDRIDNQKSETLTTRLSQQFSFRFRARRALYDCLNAGYISLIKDSAAVPAQSSAAVAEEADSAEVVWKRTRKLVNEKCTQITRPVAQNALAMGLRPVSSRTDLASTMRQGGADVQLRQIRE